MTTTTRDRGDRYGPIEWTQLLNRCHVMSCLLPPQEHIQLLQGSDHMKKNIQGPPLARRALFVHKFAITHYLSKIPNSKLLQISTQQYLGYFGRRMSCLIGRRMGEVNFG